MSTNPKPDLTTPKPKSVADRPGTKIRIFMWPKVIYLYPTAIVALLCSIGMGLIHDRTHDPTKPIKMAVAADRLAPGHESLPDTPASNMTRVDRFSTPQNLMAMVFLGMFAFNLIVMALDFPRFSMLAVILAVLFCLFFILWLGSFMQLDLLRPIHWIFSDIYAVANKGFYLMVFLTLAFVFLVIYITRWLDYWEIMPNEILHHHGPLSDLERYSTMNLKFDKEIPDVLEYMLLGAGRLVMHVPGVTKAIVMDNVILINGKEKALKNVMSRLEVRVTTDQEADEVNG
jgi:hypothetical protein